MSEKKSDRIPVYEEWTVVDVGTDDDGRGLATIDYRSDGERITHCLGTSWHALEGMRQLLGRLEVFGDGGDNWQAAESMPDWAVRRWLEPTPDSGGVSG